MKSETRFFWLTERRKFDGLSAHQAIDFLRYDGARPESNAPAGYYLFSSPGEYSGPNIGRLRSYHVEPVWLSGRMSVDAGSGAAHAWFHSQQGVKS